MAVSLDYVARETATNLWRNRVMAIAAILTVAVSLSLVGTALLLRQAVKSQFAEWSNNVSLQIFVVATATSSDVAQVHSSIHQMPEITRCAYLNHQQSYDAAKVLLADAPTAIAALTPAITPTVFRCQLQNPGEASTVASYFRNDPYVYSATFPGQSIRVMQKLEGAAQVILVVVALVLLVSSLVLILNAIRMAIFARRREVGVMKLVGATNWFIRVPFMLEGLIQGLLGAIVAVFVVLLANFGVSYIVNHYQVALLSSAVLSSRDLLFTDLVVLFFGVAIGIVGSFVAIRRFLDV
ncbi:MAG TPA: permease-like cell division protein FtsX [Acidimicrobiales bacterium]|nr:permease-like cell division protein FtsX [Acidimicrobiales bacterium]